MTPARLTFLAALAIALGACARPIAPVTAPAPVQAGAPAAEPRAESSLEVDLAHLAARDLAVPVAGVPRSRLRDSFGDARDGGARTHRAIDILAPRGTPVLAADDGIVLRLSSNTLGGITVYATDMEERFLYYYAHLDGYRPGLAQGSLLAKGDTIGYVGTTGNSPKDVPHLHFQVMRMPRDRRGWDGEPINPYPVLSRGAGTAGAARAKND